MERKRRRLAMKRISVIAWGSLVWNPRELAIASKFEPTGPHLPIEFARVSSDGRLTLVIDEKFGASCPTYSATSALYKLDDAIESLRKRENTTKAGVGFIDRATGEQSAIAIERHAQTVATIKAWAIANNYDATIWTALASNFDQRDKVNEPFSLDAAIRYLARLEKTEFSGALRYVRNAPPEVQTPVRTAVNLRWPER